MLHASCHCGAIRLEIARKPRTLTECNCGICRRYGARWAYYTSKSVRVIAEPQALASHIGRVKTFEYFHCRTCGCVTHYRRVNITDDDRIAVNARMMDPDDVADVPVRLNDARRTAKRRRLTGGGRDG